MCAAASQDISAPIQLFVPVLISRYSTSTERLNEPWQMWSLISECKLKRNISGRHGANAQLPIFPLPVCQLGYYSDITESLQALCVCVCVSWLQRAHAKQGDRDTKNIFFIPHLYIKPTWRFRLRSLLYELDWSFWMDHLPVFASGFLKCLRAAALQCYLEQVTHSN